MTTRTLDGHEGSDGDGFKLDRSYIDLEDGRLAATKQTDSLGWTSMFRRRDMGLPKETTSFFDTRDQGTSQQEPTTHDKQVPRRKAQKFGQVRKHLL